MKYLFQQMIAFFVIIITILVVVGVSFTQFSKRTMLQDTYGQMENYAKIVTDNTISTDLVTNIQTTESVLTGQGVRFFYITEAKRFAYPHSGAKASFISQEDWKRAKRGEVVRTDILLRFDDEKEKTRVAIVLQPLYTWKSQTVNEFSGVVAVLQPIRNIEQSMEALTENLFKGFLISSIVALILSYVIAQFQVNRINRMKKATKEVSQGNFDVELAINSNDELDELAQDFNAMAVALKESNAEIERQEDKRRQFMADAAHEMRTPLTTINGLLEGLAYKAIPADQEEKCIELMRNETTRLIRLVNENLDYEKIRTNQISMVIQRFSATETVRTIVEQLRGKAEAAGNSLELTTAEEVDVYADYDRFVQVMVNIVQNAIQFTENGQITIAVTKGYLETNIQICDTGIGMTPEEVANIWERYYKVDPSRKNTKYGESGLGLSIVHQLMRLHHGSVDVTSEKGVGTTFTVVFPDAPPTEEGSERLPDESK